jgi:DNA-binding NtrC family response regulator
MSSKGIEGGLPHRRHRVLVVEDEPLIRLAMAVHLEERGFYVRDASCAAEAIAILEEPNCPIDLVFSDVRMPGDMDGLGLSQWIFENRPNIPVILASGDLGKTTALKDLCGAEMIIKPYNLDVAEAKIRTAIDSYQFKS